MFSQLLTFTGATRALGQFVVGLNCRLRSCCSA